MFVGESFSFSLFSGIEIFFASEGYVTIFCQSFSSHCTGKPRKGTLLCFRIFLLSKNSMDESVG